MDNPPDLPEPPAPKKQLKDWQLLAYMFLPSIIFAAILCLVISVLL